MQIRVFQTNEDLDRVGTDAIVSCINRKPDAVLCFATGGTPITLYKQLTQAHREGRASLRHVVSFNIDEYIGLPEEHPESYHSYMKKYLFDQVDMDARNIHIPDGNVVDPHLECERYDEMLQRFGPMELLILSVGHNGHIGFNEPGEVLHGDTHIAALSEETRWANARFFDYPDEVPRQAITMGVGSLLRGPITTQCPVSLIQCHPNLTVFVDAEAAKLL